MQPHPVLLCSQSLIPLVAILFECRATQVQNVLEPSFWLLRKYPYQNMVCAQVDAKISMVVSFSLLASIPF